ncbi:MAG: hypothetical protein C0478_17315 [Planctomyces sp.]|nr:hypothetical protein [Planctomyces sp.]
MIIGAVLTTGCGNSQSPTSPIAMSEDPTWNDTAREELRESLRRCILGELRLAKREHDDIIQSCQEVYIDDQCPEDEQETFIGFAKDELKRVAGEHLIGQAVWPPETDCERLDRVEAKLRDQGILLWQVSPCCDTCTSSELPDRIDEIERRHPGFRNRVRGYAFYIDQNMPDMLADDNHISVYMAYGCLSADESSNDPDAYEAKALGIAREVCDCLREHGFEPDWDGSFSRKIGVSLNWQRRTMLK